MTQNDLKWLEESLQCEVEKYLLDAELTVEECREILDWVKDGNSVYSNPWLLYEESGQPMDFITALRALPDFADYAKQTEEQSTSAQALYF